MERQQLGALGATPMDNGAVHAIAYHAGKVYAGGTFINAGGNPNADFLAVWNGSSWAPFCNPTGPDPAFDGTVNALQIIGNTLYVGGSFQNGAGHRRRRLPGRVRSDDRRRQLRPCPPTATSTEPSTP